MAQEAGAITVMALSVFPRIFAMGGIARMRTSIKLIAGIIDAVTIPVMAKVRIGHFAEAQVLQQSASTTSTNPKCLHTGRRHYHVDKHSFKTPFVLRRARPR